MYFLYSQLDKQIFIYNTIGLAIYIILYLYRNSLYESTFMCIIFTHIQLHLCNVFISHHLLMANRPAYRKIIPQELNINSI